MRRVQDWLCLLIAGNRRILETMFIHPAFHRAIFNDVPLEAVCQIDGVRIWPSPRIERWSFWFMDPLGVMPNVPT